MFTRARSASSLLLMFALQGCGAQSNTGPAGPSAAAVAALAPLTVQVDRICEGQESQIRVFTDSQAIGMTNPGEPGVQAMVTIGEHKLSAISQRGTQWGPYATVVVPGGHLERLGCMPPPSPPPDAI